MSQVETLVGSQFNEKEGTEMPIDTRPDALADSIRTVMKQMDVYAGFTKLERAQAEIARLRQELDDNNIEVPDIDLDVDIAWMKDARRKAGTPLPETT
ncbi:hypothetical protein ACGYLO_18840 [Sulfitobacter sp. 1A13353]|jgi:hypothetical protein|uniref:hypothetical protein n=1 Tax=Sulfitobacter sp. 1A13353 TaxID=3368568 RepID=UPI003745A114